MRRLSYVLAKARLKSPLGGAATVWRHARPEPLLAALAHVEHLPQLLVRAVIYRMVTTIIFAASEPEHRADVDVYRPIVEVCLQLGA